jgi:hypothetical protein
MAAATLLATLPGNGPNQRLQVALGRRPGGPLTIELTEQHFAEGIGWFDQRTLSLEPSQFRQLQAVLGLKASEIAAAAAEPRAILPFPGPKDADWMRPAAGDRG